MEKSFNLWVPGLHASLLPYKAGKLKFTIKKITIKKENKWGLGKNQLK